MNIKQIKFTNALDYVVRRIDEDRTLTNAKKNADQYDKYVSALSKAYEFFVEGKRGKIIADSPDKPYAYHSLTISLIVDEYDDEEVTILTEILGSFDSLMFVGDSEGNTKIQLIIHDIYTEKAT